jgi:CRISPR-associated protein Cmr6
MPNIPDAAKKVPLDVPSANRRALPTPICSHKGRRTLDFSMDRKSLSQCPDFGDGVQSRTYTISWRFLTNGGQDDGISRPVIGARGWPFYPAAA